MQYYFIDLGASIQFGNDVGSRLILKKHIESFALSADTSTLQIFLQYPLETISIPFERITYPASSDVISQLTEWIKNI